MIVGATTRNENDAVSRVLERAASDPEARALALADGNAAVRRYGAVEPAAGTTVRFVEHRTNEGALIVVPPAGGSLELGGVADAERAVLEPVLRRAMSDEAFRTRVIQSPHAAIRELTGVDLPTQFTITTYDQQSAGEVVAVLPAFLDLTEELSAEELEAVAGGEEANCYFGSHFDIDVKITCEIK